jgi:hypothetical protein
MVIFELKDHIINECKILEGRKLTAWSTVLWNDTTEDVIQLFIF